MKLKWVTDLLIYLSVVLGLALVWQTTDIVPPSLYYALLAGWVAYLASALSVALGYRTAYFAVLVLAALTLAVSLPQPAHYGLLSGEYLLQAVVFVLGSVSQIALLILIPIHLRRKRGVPRNRI